VLLFQHLFDFLFYFIRQFIAIGAKEFDAVVFYRIMGSGNNYATGGPIFQGQESHRRSWYNTGQ
jgi:hypothetical protein